MDTKLRKVFDAFCTRKALHESSVRFLFDIGRINPDITAEALGLVDGDVIDAMMEQVGD